MNSRWTILAVWCCFACANIQGSDPTVRRFDRLEAAGELFEQVTVLSASPASIFIRHKRGLCQVALKDLDPELQRLFGYDATSEKGYLRKLEKEQSAAGKRALAQRANPPATRKPGRAPRLSGKFGSPVEMKHEVDFRPKFSELELGTRNQGQRPSCAVFAVVGALEFQKAMLAGKVEKLSEEYLIWATLKTLGHHDRKEGAAADPQNLDVDAGLALNEVVQALRAYGVPLRSEMPYSKIGSMDKASEPDIHLIESARERSNIGAFVVPGRTNEVKIANISHALNEGTPVVAGMAWPIAKKLQDTALLSGQSPRKDYAHAVTIIGYRCVSGKIEDATFIFRNSWGRQWGSGGYGFVRYEYLQKHLHSAVYMEVGGS